MLTVAKPQLNADKVGANAAYEKPVDLRVAPVLLDGAPLGPDALSAFGYFVYRQAAPGLSPDIWDDATKSWKSESATVVPRPASVQLGYSAADAQPWRGIIVGAGSKDSDGKPQFATASNGYPIYSVRAWFVAKSADEAMLSAPSDNIAFSSVTDSNLVAIGAGDNEQPDQATQARVLLKDSVLRPIGRLLIERNSPGAAVTLDNASGASVVLHPDGRIEITPAPGHPVVIVGDLETGRVTYTPADGSAKKVLV